MPYLDPLQTCIVTLSAPVLPSIDNLVSYCVQKTCDKKIRLHNCFDILSCLCVLAALGVVIVTILGSNDSKYSRQDPGKVELMAWVVASVALLSIRWMETNSFLCRKLIVDKTDQKVQDKGYVLSDMCSSFNRLILLTALFPTLFCPGIRGMNETYDMFMTLTNVSRLEPANCTGMWNVSSNMNSTLYCLEEGVSYWLVIGSYLAHTIGAYLTTYFGVLACRLKMQMVGFAFPLVLATPLYILMIIALNEAGKTFLNGYIPFNSDDKWLLIAFVCIGWLGQSWLCRHIWHERQHDRLEIAQQ